MAAPTPRNLASAVAQGDLVAVEDLLNHGASLDVRTADGMTPLGLAAFWGYVDITRALLKHGANINSENKGTLWTPLHCAAFQAHGPVIMKLMEYKPNLYAKDMRGRTPVDFASAHDSIWPFFLAAGCKRTLKSELIKMDIIHKATTEDTQVGRGEYEYMLEAGSLGPQTRDPNMEAAAITGDVLGEGQDLSYQSRPRVGGLNVYRN